MSGIAQARLHLRIDVPAARGSRTVSIVLANHWPYLEVGEAVPDFAARELLREMAGAAAKVGVSIPPATVVIERVEDGDVWCRLEPVPPDQAGRTESAAEKPDGASAG